MKHYRLVLQVDFGDGIYKEWSHFDVKAEDISFWDQLRDWIKTRPKGTSPGQFTTIDSFMKPKL